MTIFPQVPMTSLIVFFCHVPVCVVSCHIDIIGQKNIKSVLGNGNQILIVIKTKKSSEKRKRIHKYEIIVAG